MKLKDDCRKMFLKGHSVRTISERTGTPVHTLYNWKKEFILKKGRLKGEADLVRLRALGLTQSRIAKEFGVSQPSISNGCRRAERNLEKRIAALYEKARIKFQKGRKQRHLENIQTLQLALKSQLENLINIAQGADEIIREELYSDAGYRTAADFFEKEFDLTMDQVRRGIAVGKIAANQKMRLLIDGRALQFLQKVTGGPQKLLDLVKEER